MGMLKIFLKPVFLFNILFFSYWIKKLINYQNFCMELVHLEEFFNLCPNTTNLFIDYNDNQEEHLKHLSKFKNLENFKMKGIFRTIVFIEPFISYLNSLEDDNKLNSICFPERNITEESELCEFLKIFFEKVKPTKLEGISFDGSLEESFLISSWIEKNSTIQQLKLNCKSFSNLFSSLSPTRRWIFRFDFQSFND
jgi:hypothetical protein